MRGSPKRVGALALAGALLTGVVVLGVPGAAGADVPHGGCGAVAVGQSSGWCGLYPGNAVANVQELGQVTVSADGLSLTVQAQDASTGVVAATSFACLTATPATQITHRLVNSLCVANGGTWLPFTGGSLTVNLQSYPQFLNAQFTVQVAANADAKSSNGDAFYNNLSVSTLTGVMSN